MFLLFTGSPITKRCDFDIADVIIHVAFAYAVLLSDGVLVLVLVKLVDRGWSD
jgi:hypothetical protein